MGFSKQNAPNSVEFGTFAEQPSPEVCSPNIMPILAIERLFEIAQWRNIFIARIRFDHCRKILYWVCPWQSCVSR
jgi:hypothetical protein